MSETQAFELIKEFCFHDIEVLFLEILVLAEAMGLLKLGIVSLDGTKIKANASQHKAISSSAGLDSSLGIKVISFLSSWRIK